MAKYKVWAFDPGKSDALNEAFQLLAFAKGYEWTAVGKQVTHRADRIFVDHNTKNLYLSNCVIPDVTVWAIERAMHLFNNPLAIFPYQMVSGGFDIEFSEDGSVKIDNGCEAVKIPPDVFDRIVSVREKLSE